MPVPLAPAVRDNRFAQSLFTPLPGRYDRLAEILSMGQNARWRRTMIDKIMPADDGTVLDVASGTAGVALQVTGRSKARVVGVDLTEQMLRQGQRNVAASAQRDRIALTIGGKIHRQIDLLDLENLLGAAGNTHRLVADPLQVAVDLDHRQDEAQVDGHGLLLGQQFIGHLVQLALRGVDGPLILLDVLAQAFVAL